VNCDWLVFFLGLNAGLQAIGFRRGPFEVMIRTVPGQRNARIENELQATLDLR
jgi:hypothetical protein